MPKASNKKIGQHRKPVHPNSRKACQLQRGAHKKEKNQIRDAERTVRQNVLLEKLQWFHDHMDHSKTVHSREEVCRLIEEYLHRFDEELEQIEIINSIKHRRGRQHASRENSIKTTLELEKNHYMTGSGFEVPDLLNAKHCKFFKAWNGDSKYLTAIKLTTVKLKGDLSEKDKNEDTSIAEDKSKDTEDLSNKDIPQ
ncbi:translation machinery-associated protein 16-like [Saccoglossus kowalevskii]|uniref:Translation machinery-associated protein 16-like n=1 Tax=Saccoglossus kowalevskii TaxID=10224 RepID=A0ABM0GIC8_SACKO|nr:PREDICTED: translation machinery-associated protein 16-like [Saccoglossus kowalevskii]